MQSSGPLRAAAAATWIGIRTRIGRLPVGVRGIHILGVGQLAGIGFTVALFVTSLSFDDAAATDAAKVGILFGSLVAGTLGYAILRGTRPATDAVADAAPEREPAEEPATIPLSVA